MEHTLRCAAIATAAIAILLVQLAREDPKRREDWALSDPKHLEGDAYRGPDRDRGSEGDQIEQARDERDQVAALVSYPLRTRLKGKSLRLTTPAQFLGHYDELLPPKTRADRECVLRDARRQQSGRHDR